MIVDFFFSTISMIIELLVEFSRYDFSSFQILILIVAMQQVVALVCNFSGSHDPSNVRLNHWEVETLFHEFGHALHSLLSRTVFYQHINTML